MSEEKKFIIDEDWKAQVQAEKEAAAKQSGGEPPTSIGGESDQPAPGAAADDSLDDDPPMPPASIGMLMSSLATEALISMGQIPHPVTGETIVRRNQAQYLIDTLALLKEKTAGNLSPEEALALDDVLHQLRMAFVAK
ncbi:DUF1844 domain-containing protein [Botrimarina sp.]|uniref:DUF1844 domain-containing protein n=1 Tax=Botrimarina sp. TaxID=2795802 RepID=UPI0032EB7351